MSVLAVEVFGELRPRFRECNLILALPALSRGDLLPDPEYDRIECIFFAFQADDVVITDPAERRASYATGCFALDTEHLTARRIRDQSIRLFDAELDLVNAFVDQVQEWDPDVLSGWELQNGSWGYLLERVGRVYGTSTRRRDSGLLMGSGPRNEYLRAGFSGTNSCEEGKQAI